MEAKGWRGPPACRENVKLLLGVQLLADRLVSTQLTSSEAGRKTGSVDYSHTGRQLSTSRDDLPCSRLSWPQKQLKPFLLGVWACCNTKPFMVSQPSCMSQTSEERRKLPTAPLGAELPAAAVQGQLWLKLRARPPPRRQ